MTKIIKYCTNLELNTCMRTKYKLTIKMSDFVIYETIYHLTEEYVKSLLDELIGVDFYQWGVDYCVLDELVRKATYQGVDKNGNAFQTHSGINNPIEHLRKYPEFVVAALISQKVYSVSSFDELGYFFEEKDLVAEQNLTDETGYLGWTVEPID